MKKRKETPSEIGLSKEEQELIAKKRADNERGEKCFEEIQDILAKHKCSLGIDKNSTLSNIQIVVTVN